MKLDIEELKREATKHVVFSGSTHATYNDEWVKALARLIVERCAVIADDLRAPWGYSSETPDWLRGTEDAAHAIRQLLEDK